MIDMVEEYKKQHIDNYRKVVLEIIRNNTNVLMDEDILSLLKKPPLDSMDVIKSKFLTAAKKNKIVLDTGKLDKIVEDYRCDVISVCAILKKERIEVLSSLVASFSFENGNEIIKLAKKDMIPVNKKMKKQLKDQIQTSVSKNIVNNVKQVFTKNEELEKEEKAAIEVVKFLQGPYSRQLLESVDFKVIVKDTTLISGIKEQGDRYLFTLEKSYIFNEENLVKKGKKQS